MASSAGPRIRPSEGRAPKVPRYPPPTNVMETDCAFSSVEVAGVALNRTPSGRDASITVCREASRKARDSPYGQAEDTPRCHARSTRTAEPGSATPVARNAMMFKMPKTDVLTAIASDSPRMLTVTAPGLWRHTVQLARGLQAERRDTEQAFRLAAAPRGRLPH